MSQIVWADELAICACQTWQEKIIIIYFCAFVNDLRREQDFSVLWLR